MEFETDTVITKKLTKDKLMDKFSPYTFDTHIEEKIRDILNKRTLSLGQVLFLIETLWSKVDAPIFKPLDDETRTHEQRTKKEQAWESSLKRMPE